MEEHIELKVFFFFYIIYSNYLLTNIIFVFIFVVAIEADDVTDRAYILSL